MLSFLVCTALVATAVSACGRNGDEVYCLKQQTVQFLDQVSEQRSIPLYGGLSLSRDTSALAPAIDNSGNLDQMIYNRLIRFWKQHNVVLDFASESVEEGRRRKHKKKKLVGFAMMAAAAAAAITGPLFFGGLAAIAFKALVAAKAALTLVSISGLKMLSHHHGYSHRSDIHLPGQQHHNAGGHHGAHDMAYGGQIHGHDNYGYA